jgi:alkyldihydroxyacetonephosphate synthase
MLGPQNVRVDKRSRIEHTYGKSYRDLIRARAGIFPAPPDGVVYPIDEGQVAAILSWATERDVAVIPFGGGSSTLGDVEPQPGERLVLSLDTSLLNRVVALDPISHTARIQAGARGPELEEALNARGFTLGHFPHSFEFSTLGGWIATRSAGQASTGYGRIAEMTREVRLVSPVGLVETQSLAATMSSPELLCVLAGSEGAYGVITEATMAIHPQPSLRDYRGFLFHQMKDGVAALRTLVQQGPRPTVANLSDAAETASLAMLSSDHPTLRAIGDRMLEMYLTWKEYDLANGSCFLIVGYDGEPDQVAKQWQQATAICRDHEGLPLGRTPGTAWKRDRFTYPYLRDTLIGMGVMVDTIETVTSWSNLLPLYKEVTSVLRTVIPATGGGTGYVKSQVYHARPSDACLSMTFIGRQVPGEEIEQWWAVRRAAMEVIAGAGGTLSYPLSAEQDRAKWLAREVGPIGVTILRALKQALDPAGIMNPGVLPPV